MNGSASLGVRSEELLDSAGTTGEPALAPAEQVPAARVDFAHVFGEYLLVYGWIFGLSASVAGADIRHGETTVDLLSCAMRVARPDVTQHLAAGASDDDRHGFCLLAALTESGARHGSLTLSVVLNSGESAQSLWPVGSGNAQVIAFFRQHPTMLDGLLSHLQAPLAEPLRELVAPLLSLSGASSGPVAGPVESPTTPAPAALPFQFDIDLCCILENRILLILGWLLDPDGALISAEVRIGAATRDFLGGMEFTSRPDIDAKARIQQRSDTPPRFGFTFLSEVRNPARAVDEVVLSFHTKSGQTDTPRRVSADPLAARNDLANLLNKLDSDAAIALIERIAALLTAAPGERSLFDFLQSQHTGAVERLPVALECAQPRFLLHLDRVVPIAEAGIFLNGWFDAEPEGLAGVACHNGFTSVRISDTWSRHTRADVAAHLAKLGITSPESEHGFACYVPLKTQRSPYFISVTAANGLVRRLRTPTPVPGSAALETVRAVLTSFGIQHRELRSLLDRHVGPAVRAAWTHRRKAVQKLTLHHYGARPADPPVSIIVPLYGRFDLAEYQLALFADDAQIQALELIYFVDDPTIYDAFHAQCADLYEVYQVPFSVAFCGANLGFAGANNRAARIARGRHLLLMNSDVFPRRSGWAGQMLELYRKLPDTGMLGCKLLFEDGSVQHAGMSFRQHRPWSDLWINYHPHKGQSGVGLDGVREVDAVTAACVLVDAELYHEMGGLSEEYIIGDFEDSDLCLRVAAAGRCNRVALDIEMYHLERQSQDRIGDSQWRTNLTVYNCWQHHQRWAAQLGKPRS